MGSGIHLHLTSMIMMLLFAFSILNCLLCENFRPSVRSAITTLWSLYFVLLESESFTCCYFEGFVCCYFQTFQLTFSNSDIPEPESSRALPRSKVMTWTRTALILLLSFFTECIVSILTSLKGIKFSLKLSVSIFLTCSSYILDLSVIALIE